MRKTNIQWLWKKFVIIAGLMAFISGCSVQASHPALEGKDVSLNYVIVQPPYTQDLAGLVNSLRQKGGVKSIQVNNDTVVVISLGQRPSAGYKVVLESVEKKDGKLLVKYTEKKTESMALSVITYPSIVLKITNSLLPVEVKKV
jgi:hypothetical protein